MSAVRAHVFTSALSASDPVLDLRLSDSLLRTLQESLAVLSPELVPIHERLVVIRRQLVALAAKGHNYKSELKPIQEELRKIDAFSVIPAYTS